MKQTRWTTLLLALLVLTAGVWACDCGDTTLQGCLTDEDCPDGQECVCADGGTDCEQKVCQDIQACDTPCDTVDDCTGDCMACVDGCCESTACETDADCPPEGELLRYCSPDPNPDTGCRECLYVRCETDEECADPTFPLYLACGADETSRCARGTCECVPPCGGDCPTGRYCCQQNDTCEPIPVACEGVECPDCEQVNPEPGGTLNEETCVLEGTDCSCVPLDPLDDAFEGLHSAIDLDAAGIPVLSGYFGQPYGDLLYGVASDASAGATVTWTIVDGLPVDAPCEGAADGPRNGIAEPGDDVGWDTDIVVDGNGLARISYHDLTNGDLKYAAFDGAAWNVHVVDEAGETGRFTSMALDGAGNPVIAYMTVRENFISHLKVAWATVPEPVAAADWTFYTLDSLAVPCRPEDCVAGEVCLLASGTCAVADDPANCDGGNGCPAGEACVAATCQEETPESTLEDLPLGVGLFASLDLYTDGSPAVAYYDSVNGNLKYVAWNGVDAFDAPVLLDGEDGGGNDTGDVGVDVSLFIASDDVAHLVYQDAALGILYYWNANLGTAEIVDQGARDGNGDPTDLGGAVGDLHWVGNFARVAMDAAGNARVAYQDGTSLDMLTAVRSVAGVWTVSILARKLPDPGFDGAYGFFIDQVMSAAGDMIHLSNFKHNLRTDPWSSVIDLRTHIP